MSGAGAAAPKVQPLKGIRILDFSTLLPGPLATLMLAEAGAEVIKLERAGSGDDMRGYQPKLGDSSVNFAMLNRGKKSIAVDLKDPPALKAILELVREADVVVEQFRPGVMDRLGLGYQALQEINPGLIYCSITGYGQTGSASQRAGHDLNYIAETGLLSLSTGADGAPILPPVLAADIGGGAYPATLNILLALIGRQQTGRGMKLDVAMSDNVFPFQYWAMGTGFATGAWPGSNDNIAVGNSPRYQIYRTADDRFIAVAAIEEKFWRSLCELLQLPAELADDARDPAATRSALATSFRRKTAAQWQGLFGNADVCCSVVASVAEAVRSQAVLDRDLFSSEVTTGEHRFPAMALPLDAQFRSPEKARAAPALGEHNSLLQTANTGAGNHA